MAVIDLLPSGIGSLKNVSGSLAHSYYRGDRSGSATETSTFTASVAGTYIVHGFAFVTNNTSSLSITTDGTQIYMDLLNNTNGKTRVGVFYLEAGQYIRCTMGRPDMSNQRSGCGFYVIRIDQ